MATIALVACASKKRAAPARAADLYDSPLFHLSLRYARRRRPDAIYILSAKHGLLALDEVIAPYDVTLSQMTAGERRKWAQRVIAQLEQCADLRSDHFVILAGARYREHLLPHLASYETPLEGLAIGKQLQWLKLQLRDG